MPIYEYRCDACGHKLDALQKLSDEPLKECPECLESALKRLISAPVFRLKGGGWYETDFKSDQEKKRNLAGSGESKGDSSGDSDKADGSSKTGDAKSADAKSADGKGASQESAAAKKPAEQADKKAAKPVDRTADS